MATKTHHTTRALPVLATVPLTIGAVFLLTIAAVFLLTIAAVFLLTIAAPAAKAETSPEAQAWLEKMIAVYDQGPLTMDYVATIDLNQVGQEIQGDLDGTITYGDRRHMRMALKVKLAGLAAGADPEEAMELSMLTVSDGETIWSDIDMALGRQVMRIAIEDAERLAASQGSGFAGNPSSMDPVAQLELLTKTLDFELEGVKDGRVTLRAQVKPEARDGLGQLGALGAEAFVMVIDEKTGHPIELWAGEPKPVIRMQFRNLKQVSRDSLPEGVFDYTPPDGVPVTDLAAMLDQMGQMGQ